MANTNEPVRRHPDLFTPAEAIQYLRMDELYPDKPAEELARTLETLRTSHGLKGQKIGKAMMYHRRHLDALVLNLYGIEGISLDPRTNSR